MWAMPVELHAPGGGGSPLRIPRDTREPIPGDRMRRRPFDASSPVGRLVARWPKRPARAIDGVTAERRAERWARDGKRPGWGALRRVAMAVLTRAGVDSRTMARRPADDVRMMPGSWRAVTLAAALVSRGLDPAPRLMWRCPKRGRREPSPGAVTFAEWLRVKGRASKARQALAIAAGWFGPGPGSSSAG